MGFTPCGVAFGALRKCYTAPCNFHADEVAGGNFIRWYRVHPDTPIYQGLTVFTPGSDVPDREPTGPFEQTGNGRTTRLKHNGFNYSSFPGISVDGDAQDFRGRSPLSKHFAGGELIAPLECVGPERLLATMELDGAFPVVKELAAVEFDATIVVVNCPCCAKKNSPTTLKIIFSGPDFPGFEPILLSADLTIAFPGCIWTFPDFMIGDMTVTGNIHAKGADQGKLFVTLIMYTVGPFTVHYQLDSVELDNFHCTPFRFDAVPLLDGAPAKHLHIKGWGDGQIEFAALELGASEVTYVESLAAALELDAAIGAEVMAAALELAAAAADPVEHLAAAVELDATETSPPPWALIAHAKTADNVNGGSTSAIDTTGGDLLIFTAAWYGPGGNPTPTDNKSNTWIGVAFIVQGELKIGMWYAKNATCGSGHTFSMLGFGTAPSAQVQAWHGSDLTSPLVLDDNNQGTSGSGVAYLDEPSIDPTNPDELFAASLGLGGGAQGGDASIDEGYTITDQSNYTSGTNEGGALAWAIKSAATSPRWSWPNSSVPVRACILASFKHA